MNDSGSRDRKILQKYAGKGRTVSIIAGGLIIAAVLLAIGIVPRLRQGAELVAAAQGANDHARVVAVVTPHRASEGDHTLPGNTQAIEEATLYARTSGYLRQRYVDIGSRVKAGQVLAVIESPEVDQQLLQARADAAKSQAGIGQAQADFARLQAGVVQSQADSSRLQAVVIQTQSETTRLQANVEQARSDLAKAQAKLAQARATSANAKAKVSQANQVREQRKADLAQVEARLLVADKTLKRYKQLVQEGAVSAQDLDERQSTNDAAFASVSAAKAAISSAEADVEAAKETVNATQADVEAAQADVSSSRQNIDAAQAAVRSNLANVQAAQEAVRSSQANILAAQEGVRASKSSLQANVAAAGSSQANVQRVAVLKSFENIVAPFDGIITARNVDTGALISAGGATGGDTAPSSTTPRGGLFGIARADNLRIQVNAPQSYALSISPGQQATVLFREFPGREFTGTIAKVAGALDSASRTLLAEIHLRNRDGLLRPGMYADVRLTASRSQDTVRIPASALSVTAEGTRVASITADRKVHYLTVQVGRDFGTEVEIRKGLQGNEQLVSNPTDDLAEGAAVTVAAAQAK